MKVEVDFKWDETFFKYFTIDGNFLIPKKKDMEFHVDPDDMIIHETNMNSRYRLYKFFIMEKNDKRVYLESPIPLYIPDSEIFNIGELYDEENGYYTIDLKRLGGFDYLFMVIIKNTGIADPLLEIKDALEKNRKMNLEHNQDFRPYFQELIDLLIKSKTYVTSIHLETILHNMIKIKDREVILKDESIDLFEGFNTRKYYKIYSINDAIYQSRSALNSLMFERNLVQLTTDSFNDLFTKRATSEFDRMFIDS